MYIESVMNSGCKNADIVGNNLGALPSKGSVLLAKMVNASDCLQGMTAGLKEKGGSAITEKPLHTSLETMTMTD